MSTIKIVDYDPSWPALFRTESASVAALIGDLVEDIHHIGSTSVPGLPAKPKIDIDAVMRSGELLAEAIRRLEAAGGYAFHGDRYGDGMWTFTRGHGSYGARLYLCGPGNATHMKRIFFRDWLRAHPDAAAAYAALKRRLAAEANGDWNFYTGGKSEFVAEIVRLALDGGPPLPVYGERDAGRQLRGGATF
jgi:GrpB-like predicted nucleotidyltransferase (UPF0157 family)